VKNLLKYFLRGCSSDHIRIIQVEGILELMERYKSSLKQQTEGRQKVRNASGGIKINQGF